MKFDLKLKIGIVVMSYFPRRPIPILESRQAVNGYNTRVLESLKLERHDNHKAFLWRSSPQNKSSQLKRAIISLFYSWCLYWKQK